MIPVPSSRPSSPALVYAIGDIHGCLPLLQHLWRKIARDAQRQLRRGARARVVFLGNLVDRGPQSAQVLEWCVRLFKDPPAWCEPVFLMGCHEFYLVLHVYRQSPEMLQGWLHNGGEATLRSFGIKPGTGETIARLLNLELLHRGILPLLLQLEPSHSEPGYMFVSAGLRPGLALKEQHLEHLLWSHDEFLNSTQDHGATVVHGHAPHHLGKVEIRPNRICVDSGAVHTGTLSAVRLFRGRTRVLKVTRARADRS